MPERWNEMSQVPKFLPPTLATILSKKMVNATSSKPIYTVRKHIRSWSQGKDTAMDIVREIRVLTHEPIRKHPDIISLVVFEWVSCPGEEPSLCLVLCLERSELGDLASFQRAARLSYQVKKGVFLDVANGISALHSSGIVHGDVKSENVLIFRHEDGYLAKLCDFGFAILTADIRGEKARLRGGTSPWTAPEWRKELPCPRRLLKLTDVYSLGLLFWRMLLDGANPFNHDFLGGRDVQERGLIVALMVCTIQKEPTKRKLWKAIQIAIGRDRPVLRGAPQLSNNPIVFARDALSKNACVPVRVKVMEYVRRSGIVLSADPAWTTDFPGENPVTLGLIEHALGDGGLDMDDNPAEALEWITYLVKQLYVPMQGVIVRMNDYFDQAMPRDVQKEANEFLANGVVNGSLTAQLDYEKYWPTLQYQTHGNPDDLFFMSRTFYGNGTGFQLDQRAAELGDTATVYRNILLHNGDPSILQVVYGLDRGNALLHGCAMLGLVETAQMLLTKFRVEINVRNDHGDTPVLLAVRNGKFLMILKLIARGARADIPNKHREGPMHWVLNIPSETIVHEGASGNKLLLAIDMLLHSGGGLDAQADMWWSGGEHYNRLRWAAGTPLHRAVSRRNLDAARALLMRGADATTQDDVEGLTPLDLAMHHHNEPMLRLLLDTCTFDLNSKYTDRHALYSKAVASVTILEIITIHGKDYPKAVHDTLDLLVSRGFDLTRAKVDGPRGSEYELDALFVAVAYEKLVWAQCLLSNLVDILDINRRNGEHAMTALHQSIHDHRKSLFLALLDAGADPTLTCSSSSVHSGVEMRLTCLHLVAQQGDPDSFFTSHLLKYDLDVNAPDFYGISPFATAVIEGDLHIANMLLQHGADINMRMGPKTSLPETRRTILGMILVRDCTLILNRLKYLVLDSEDIDPALQRQGSPAAFEVGEGTSAFHVFLNGHGNRQDAAFRESLQVLLKTFPLQSQRDYTDDQGRTALDIARANGNHLAAAALEAAGAACA